MPKRKKTDWEGLEREYRIGQKTLKALSTEFDIHSSNICRRAKKCGWTQDKSEEVRRRTSAALIAQRNRKRNFPTETDLDRAVNTNIKVILGHQKTITNLNNFISGISTKLEEHEKADSEKDRKKDIRFRVSAVKELSFAIKNLIPLERQAFNIDSERSGPVDGLSELLTSIAGATRGLPNRTQRKL